MLLAGCAPQEGGGQKEDGVVVREVQVVLAKETDEIRGWAGHAFKGFINTLCVYVCVCLYVYVLVHVHACMPGSMYRGQNKFSFYHVAPSDPAQVIRLGDKSLSC